MPILPSALLSARPVGPAPTAPPVPFGIASLPTPALREVRPTRSAPAPKNTVVLTAVGGAGATPSTAKSSGRTTKEERKREARMAVNAEIRALVDAKPTKREVRNFLHRRMSYLNDA
jgi:hypothetical protein